MVRMIFAFEWEFVLDSIDILLGNMVVGTFIFYMLCDEVCIIRFPLLFTCAIGFSFLLCMSELYEYVMK